MQVERLSEQNNLMKLQSLSAHQQIALHMRSEIVGVETLGTLAQELHTLYAQDETTLKGVTARCGQTEADWQSPLNSWLKHAVKISHLKIIVFKLLLSFLAKRSKNLESNRLLNQQITGSALRLSVFSRDLTEQFISQFSTMCNTDPNHTATIGRIWAAMEALETGMSQFMEEFDREEDIETFYLSGTPDSQIIHSIEEYLRHA